MADEQISIEEKTMYYQRLTKPYNKNGMRFIDDYMDGSGKELIEKFWSIISSSRLAFDLYSWIVEEENIICEMYFEKKLPGVILNHRESLGVPNMDVFIKTIRYYFHRKQIHRESNKGLYKWEKTTFVKSILGH